MWYNLNIALKKKKRRERKNQGKIFFFRSASKQEVISLTNSGLTHPQQKGLRHTSFVPFCLHLALYRRQPLMSSRHSTVAFPGGWRKDKWHSMLVLVAVKPKQPVSGGRKNNLWMFRFPVHWLLLICKSLSHWWWNTSTRAKFGINKD